MLAIQIRTSDTVKAKLADVGGMKSEAFWIVEGLRWRLAHEPCPKESFILDAKRKIRMIASEKKNPKHPIVVLIYQMVTGYYSIELTDVLIIP